MPNKIKTQAWKAFDYTLCKTAGVVFNTIQIFNKYKPNPNFTPKWSDKPLLKSWKRPSQPLAGRGKPIRSARAA